MKKLKFTMGVGERCSYRDKDGTSRVAENGHIVACDNVKHPKPQEFVKAGMAKMVDDKNATKEVK